MLAVSAFDVLIALVALGLLPAAFAAGWFLVRRRQRLPAGRKKKADAVPGDEPPSRNPGPPGGYALIGFSLRHLPAWFNRVGLKIGAGIAVATLPWQRRNSREYLRCILGREPTWREVGRHFHAYAEFLFLRLSIVHGLPPRLQLATGEDDAELRALAASRTQTLYGTMHLGHSDLLGYFLRDLGASVHMVRKRVGNAADVDGLGRRYAGGVTYLWVNRWSERVWAMNEALRAGHSVAMQCDRPEHSAKLEPFRFLGARRLFPFTIYHLAIMHGVPVAFAFAVADEADPDATVIRVPPVFRPRAERSRPENFAAAREHFQAVLDRVEAQLRRTPFQWFNFTALNPVAAAESSELQEPGFQEGRSSKSGKVSETTDAVSSR